MFEPTYFELQSLLMVGFTLQRSYLCDWWEYSDHRTLQIMYRQIRHDTPPSATGPIGIYLVAHIVSWIAIRGRRALHKSVVPPAQNQTYHAALAYSISTGRRQSSCGDREWNRENRAGMPDFASFCSTEEMIVTCFDSGSDLRLHVGAISSILMLLNCRGLLASTLDDHWDWCIDRFVIKTFCNTLERIRDRNWIRYSSSSSESLWPAHVCYIRTG